MKNQVDVLNDRVKELELENENLINENKSLEELRVKFDKLYNHCQELQVENEQLTMDKEVVKEYLEKNQIEEREFLLLKRNANLYKEQVHALEEDMIEILSQMEQQEKVVQEFMAKYESSQEKIRKLMQEKTNLQARNVDLLEEIRVLNKKVSILDDVDKFKNLENDIRYKDILDSNNKKDIPIKIYDKDTAEK